MRRLALRSLLDFVSSVSKFRIGSRSLGKSGQLQCNAGQPCAYRRSLSARADALLHGIQPGSCDARRLPSRVSRFPRMRADASRPRCHVFRAGPYWNAGNSRREHAQFVSFSNGHRDQPPRFFSVVPTLSCILPEKGANGVETAVRHRPKVPLLKSKQTAVY